MPAGQAEHFADPPEDAYKPTGHGEQLVDPSEEENVPVAQSVQVIARIEEWNEPNFPFGHSEHTPEEFINEPAKQHVADPAAE